MKTVVFDRGGFKYSRRVKALAQAPVKAAWNSKGLNGEHYDELPEQDNDSKQNHSMSA